MKLKELLTNIFGDKSIVTYPNDQFRKLELEPLKEELLKCDEFSECEGIEFMEMPVQEIDEKTYAAQTAKLGDNTKFDGKVFLYNLSFTPEMFDPNSLYKPVKNGALITPALYDPMTFLPTKKIVLTWNPEMAQDISGVNDEIILKHNIHKLLDDVLDNPEEYRAKGERSILVRGVFKTKNVDRNEPPYLTGTPMEPNDYMAFYLEKYVLGGEMNLIMKQKVIPKHLKDEFIKRFTNNGGITTATTEEIENFIKKNTMERDTSWDDPQLSDGDMPIRQQNALKNTFPKVVEKWKTTGLLDGLNQPDKKNIAEILDGKPSQMLNDKSDKPNMAELMESEASKLLKEEFNQLNELNDYLKMLADMDKIGIRRKIVLLEGYVNKIKNNI
jgi:hypothetical protein